jgi:acetylornithine/N-succinyldiaminopimelate aminotransferase
MPPAHGNDSGISLDRQGAAALPWRFSPFAADMQIEPAALAALMEVTERPQLVMVRGAGSWIEDHRGKRYLDFLQGWAVNALGHCPPEIQAAIAEQAGQLINPSPAFHNQPALDLAGRLTKASGLDRVFFASSGAEANEGAVKLARKWGRVRRNGAFEIITFENAFHGRTLAMMSASGKPGWDTMFAPAMSGFRKARFNDLDSVRALIGPQTAAIMLEPVQGESGVVPARPEFMGGLRALAVQHGLLLIFDEVQTGMGRLGTLFGFEHYGVRPDIMTLAKGIGGGLPLAALVATEEASLFSHGEQGGTYCGNPLTAAVGVAMFDAITAPGFLETVNARAGQLSDGLQSLVTRHSLVGERGMGLLRALVLDSDRAARTVEAARDLQPEGLLLNAPRPNVLRFMPALNVTATEIDTMLERLDGLL